MMNLNGGCKQVHTKQQMVRRGGMFGRNKDSSYHQKPWRSEDGGKRGRCEAGPCYGLFLSIKLVRISHAMIATARRYKI